MYTKYNRNEQIIGMRKMEKRGEKMLEILMSEINFDVINVVPFRMQRQR